MANERYWVGGTGLWNGTNQNNWSTSAAITFTASCDGTTLTTTGSPALSTGMTVWSSSFNNLGTITGGSGNSWTVSGGGSFASQTMSAATVGATIPTSTNPVIFNQAGTYTVTVSTVTASCYGLTVSAGTVTIAGTVQITNYKDLNIIAGTIWNHSGTLGFDGSVSLNRAITTNGVVLNCSIRIISNNPNYIVLRLGSDLTIAGTIDITGTFDTSDGLGGTYNLTAGGLTCSVGSSTTATINLNSSTVTLTGGTPINFTATGTLNFNAGTSSIYCSYTSSIWFYGLNKSFYNVFFNGVINASGPMEVKIRDNNTFNNLSFTPPGASIIREIYFYGNQTISGTLSVSGTTAVQRLSFFSDALGATRTLTVASFSASPSDIDFRDITLAGAAVNTSITRGGDCGGNSGIGLPGTKTVYWNLAGTQNWSAAGWCTSSDGGVTFSAGSINNIPLAQDTAIFNNNGSVGTVTINSYFNIGTVDMSNRTSAMTMSINKPNISIYKDWINGSGVTISSTGTLFFRGRGNVQNITSAGKSFTSAFVVTNVGGSVKLLDDYTSNYFGALLAGTLDLNGNNITLSYFNITNTGNYAGQSATTYTKSIAFGSNKTMTLTTSGTTVFNNVSPTNFSCSGTGTISMTAATAKTFVGGSATYSGVTLNNGAAGALTITGSNTFEGLSNSVQPTSFLFTAGTTTTINQWNINGASGSLVTIGSPTSASHTISKSSGTVNGKYLDISYSTVSGGAFWNAYYSKNSFNNTGWQFGERFLSVMMQA